MRPVIRARMGDGEAAERLFDDLAARLDDPAYELDALERPVEELVQMLCRDLGLEPDPARETPRCGGDERRI